MNILLCCSAGMSTSLLVSRMEKAAVALGIEAHIWSVGSDGIRSNFDEADVLLLGPQVRFLLTELKALGSEKGIPVDVINMMHYGMVNGEEVLKQALSLLGK
jgi:PTS system cellobiose-specific IIB component